MAFDWGAVSALATSLGVVGALGYNGWALRDTRRRSNAAADRAESAARLSIDNNDRLIEAIRSISIQTGVVPEDKKVRWSLVYERGDTFRLTNVGSDTAFGVEVRAHQTMFMCEISHGDPSEVKVGEALLLMVVAAWGTEDMTITVAWHDALDSGGEDALVWRYPLPAKVGGGGD